MIDSHAHLDMIERPTTEVVADAEQAGVHRVLTIGIDGSSCRVALQLAEDFPQVRVAVGRHPNAATGFDEVIYRPPSRRLPGFVGLVKPLRR